MTETAKVPVGGNAPYKIIKQGGKWVVKNNVGDVKATFDGDDAGYQKALAYQRALYVNVPGAAKRADKTPFTGNARRRGPAYKKKAEMSDLRDRLVAAYGPADLPPHDYVPGSTGVCMSCGLPEVHPLHDEWPVNDPGLDEDEGLLGNDVQPKEVSAYSGGGCMVALFLDDETAKKLAVEGGEAPDDMHITLAYMKDQPDPGHLANLQSLVETVADQHPPLDGVWGGTGTFNGSKGSDGKPVTVALPDLPGLPQLRHDLVAKLDAAGFTVSKDHGYTPHTTIQYGPGDADAPAPKAKGDLEFDSISLVVGSKRWDYPLHVAKEQAKEFTDDKRDDLAGEGKALPDGSFPIENEADLKNAIQAVGRAKNPAAARRHIRKRAKALGATDLIPDSWEKASWELSRADSASVETAEVGPRDIIAALDAGIDQVMVLLRSVSSDDLPPYALQARDLLGAVDLAMDGLMEMLGIDDPDDDDGPDAGDVTDAGDPVQARDASETAAMTSSDKAEFERESESINQNKERPEAKVPHKFRPARWTHPNGHPRCLVCGDEEPISNVCKSPVPPPAETSSAMVTERMATVEDAPVSLPAVRAFLTEVHGKTLLTAPASTFTPEWEKALTPNQHFLWMQGRFVGAEEANRNGAFWSNKDLEMGEATVKGGPLNWLHEDRHIIGSIADAKLVSPSFEAAAAGAGKHIAAIAAMWSWIFPDEAYVIEQASDQQKLWYSMECISREVACIGDNGCGKTYSYRQTIQGGPDVCQHIRERSSTRHFIDPTFLGGAVIVPPVRPGWGDANAQVMREAASMAEHAFEVAGNPDITASDWELLMASVIASAEA